MKFESRLTFTRFGRVAAIATACLFLAVGVSACGDDTETTDDYYQAEMWPSTHVLGDELYDHVTSIDESGTFLFKKDSTVASGLAVGHVLMGGGSMMAPGGFLRRVTSVTETPDAIAVTTEPALLQQAFKHLHVKFDRTVDLSEADLDWQMEPGAKIIDSPESVRSLKKRESGGHYMGPFTIDYYPFNGDSDDSSPEDQIHVVGTFEGGVEYQMGIDFDWPDVSDVLSGDPIPEIVAGFYVKAGAKASLDVDGMARYKFDRQDTLAHAYVGSFWIGPLFFTVYVDLLSRVEGGASSRFIMHTGAGAGFEAGAQYSTDDGGKLVPPTATYDLPTPTVTATESAYLKASIGPRLRLALYDFFGPHVTVWAFGKLTADADADPMEPCWDLRAGVYGDIGIDLTIFGETIADWSEPFDIWSTSIASGECVPDPNAPEVPDLIDPTFTPWSKVLQQAAGPFTIFTDFADIQGTVDGHWLLSGSSARALTKLTSDADILWSRQYFDRDSAFLIPMSVNRAVNTQTLGIFATSYSPVTLLKLDADGGVIKAWKPDIEWQPVLGMNTLLELSDGTFLVGGRFEAIEDEPTDAWLFRVDADGNVLWSKTWGRSNIDEWVTSAVELDGDIVVVGQSFGLDQDPARQSFAMRLGFDGSTKWVREIRGLAGTEGLALSVAHVSRDGDIIVGGSYGLGGPDVILIKIKPDASEGWATGSYGGGIGLELTDFFQLSDGGYVMTGIWWTAGTDHLWLARTDSVGSITWLKKYEDGFDNGASALAMTGEGGAMMAAYTENDPDSQALWVSRIPIKTGELTFADSTVWVSTETPVDAPDPAMEFVASTVELVDQPLSLVEGDVYSNRFQPVVTTISQ